jgi:hypothetical protein
MQYLQPMQVSASTTTMPSSSRFHVAFVGQTETHGGLSQ